MGSATTSARPTPSPPGCVSVALIDEEVVAARGSWWRGLARRLRELALLTLTPPRQPDERAGTPRRRARRFPSLAEVGADGAAVGRAGRGAAWARRDRRVVARRGPGGAWDAAQGLPQGDVRLALLRRLAQPLVELVLDVICGNREKARAYRRRRGGAG